MDTPELPRIARAGIGLGLGVLMALVTLFFGRQFLAGVDQLRGKGSFYRNDVSGALKHYAQARRFGGGGLQLDSDEVEAIFFAVDQMDLGVKSPLTVTADDAIARATEAVRGLVQRAPYRAYFWSIASDLYMRRSRERRRTTPLDLAELSENPLDNLLPETWFAIVTMKHASRLEPNNYLYHDLLVEAFLDVGSPEAAADHCRQAIKALPRFDAHEYLLRSSVPPELVEASVKGFEDALAEVSLIGRASIECSLADMLMRNGQYDRAIPYLLSALESVPDSFDAHYFLGNAQLQRGHYEEALQHLKISTRVQPTEPMPYYYLSKSYEALGDLDQAVSSMQNARMLNPHDLQLFHALGALLEKADRITEAERQFVAATSYNPENPYAWSMLVDFYRRHDDGRAVRKACESLRSLRPGDTTYQSQCPLPGEGVP
jgi:tetratricopeptide (TPR) repeat protein